MRGRWNRRVPSSLGALGALIVASACGREDSGSGRDSVQPARDVRIAIERTPCYGRCPIYQLQMDSSGKVVYEGKGFVQVMGRQEGTVAGRDVQALARELEAAGYLGFRDNYAAEATDHPSVITTLTIDGKTKRVEHDLSSRTAPPQLESLERRIDEVANSARWVGADSSSRAPASRKAPGDTAKPRR